MQQLIKGIQEEEQQPHGFELVEGRLLYKGRIMVPSKSPITHVLLREYHDSPLGGHAGELKTYLRLAIEWYWVGMRKDISKYIHACATCRKQKALNTSPAGLLQPLSIPTQV